MITPGLLLRLREVADIGPDDFASFAMLRIGDHDAREILAAVDTMQAVRVYLAAPSPSLTIAIVAIVVPSLLPLPPPPSLSSPPPPMSLLLLLSLPPLLLPSLIVCCCR